MTTSHPFAVPPRKEVPDETFDRKYTYSLRNTETELTGVDGLTSVDRAVPSVWKKGLLVSRVVPRRNGGIEVGHSLTRQFLDRPGSLGGMKCKGI